MTDFADVVFPRPLLRSYTYAVPAGMAPLPGARVQAPLGRTTAVGVVVRIHGHPPDGGIAVKPIEAVIDADPLLPDSILDFTRRLSDAHASPWGEMLGLALPPDPVGPRKRRAPRSAEPGPAQLELDLELTPAAADAAREAVRALKANRSAELYAWGGDGARRALWAEAARGAAERGRNALLLLPDLGRAEAFRGLFEQRTGLKTTVFHGKLGPRAQAERWEDVCRGQSRIIVGSRAALFKPWPGLGLIMVEDESDEAHLQAESPAFDVRRGARIRAEAEKAVVLFGAAVPTVEAFASAEAKGSLRALGGDDPAKEVLIVDDGAEKGLVSAALGKGLREALALREPAIVFLNRRGYASVLFCPRCGAVPRCGRCGAALSFHKRENVLVCHTCGAREERPVSCPSCGSRVLEPRGAGLEALEEEIRRLFPKARMAAFDRDRVRTAAAGAEILEAFDRGRIDILLGTQLLARRADPRPAGFVGILNPEAWLAVPDFTASQRAFQSMARMLRFAPVRKRRPAAVIQTGFPGHHSVQGAAGGDFSLFYSREMEIRRIFRQPPFAAMAEVTLRGRDPRSLGRKARALAARWAEEGSGIEVLGPSFETGGGGPAEKRVQIVLRADRAEAITAVLADGLRDAGAPFSVLRYD